MTSLVRFAGPNFGNDVSESAGTLTGTLTLSAPSTQAVSVTVRGESFSSADLDSSAKTVTFAPGQTSATFTTAVYEDTLYEGDEIFRFYIASATGAQVDRSENYIDSLYGHVLDNDQPTQPLVRFAGPNFGNDVSESAGTLTGTLTLSAPSTQAVSVTVRGDADRMTDMDVSDKVVTFAPGQTSATFTARIFDDAVYEGGEAYAFRIVSATGATLDTSESGSSSVSGILLDNDQPLSLPAPWALSTPFRQYSFDNGILSGVEGTYSTTGARQVSFVDGRLVLDVTDPFAVAYRMYDTAFDRLPDTLGLNQWSARLQAGLALDVMASGFADSAEFQQTYGALDNRGFVEQLYRNVLDREGDAQGISGWASSLDQGVLTRGQVLVGFSESPEHIEKLRGPVMSGLWDGNEAASSVARLYHAALDRAPDASGLTGWTRAVEGGRPLAQVADGFAFSAEFQAKYGALSNEGYVRQLYLNVLDREADASGLAGWTAELSSGRLDRGDVLLGFSESLEFQIKTQPLTDGGILLV